MKLNPNGSLAHLKAHLVAKGYSQVYGMNYQDTFSSVAKMTSVLKSCCSSIRKELVGYRRVYAMKINLDVSLAHSKARLVAKSIPRCMEWIIKTPSCHLLKWHLCGFSFLWQSLITDPFIN